MHRDRGVEVGKLEGGTGDQEGGVDLISPPAFAFSLLFLFVFVFVFSLVFLFVFLIVRGEDIHSLSHLPWVSQLVCVRDEVE